ncbi:hypothetical protein [Sediminibacterium sp.]|uniref:hypothetical protein n=1 Tax=Sediminibacterium sp. TaxID=1917865 RepID=UPI0025FF1E58|nr:hypothetical protein [Sediminibacterium sp.]
MLRNQARIISLVPSITELLYSLGLSEQVEELLNSAFIRMNGLKLKHVLEVQKKYI